MPAPADVTSLNSSTFENLTHPDATRPRHRGYDRHMWRSGDDGDKAVDMVHLPFAWELVREARIV